MADTQILEKTFLTEDFLLKTDFAKALYHNYAKDLPIIDYHCHLPPDQIAADSQFDNLTRIWLQGDHYKWRAMRTMGVSEHFIIGKASDKEKFEQWANTVPYTMRNPLYHWSHLELKRYFDVDVILNEKSGEYVYDTCSSLLRTPEYSTRQLLSKMQVETVCTTDDPADDLKFHQKIKADGCITKVFPAFRPDKAYAIEDHQSYVQYLEKLGAASGVAIDSFDQLLLALSNRITIFNEQGCSISDHGLEHLYFPQKGASYDINTIFRKAITGKEITTSENHYFKYTILIELCKLYHVHGWVQQFHLGALRNNNSRMLNLLGPDTGYDSIGDFSQAVPVARFLDALNRTDQLAKTILYNLNPSDNEVMAAMTGNFNDGSVKGKIQFGSAWWFLDQKDGMEKQINALSNLGLLSCFVGMLTDSRSFMSYPRHEYFRRILCNIIGNDVENGELPADEKWLGKLVSDICYHNAKEYFKF